MARNVYVRGHYRRTRGRRSSAGDEVVGTIIGWLILACVGLFLLAWLVTQWWAWVVAVGLAALVVRRCRRARDEAEAAALAAQVEVERRAAEYALWEAAEAQRHAAAQAAEAERQAAAQAAEAERRARAPRSRYIPNHVMVEVAARDGGACRHCGGRDNLAFDHIIPFSQGGASDCAANIQILCRPCNSSKRDRFVG